MTRGKWMYFLVLLLGILILVGCGGSDEKTPAPGAEQTQDNKAKEEPKAEAPKAEEPKAEAPKAEEPKAEAPKTVEPKAEAPKVEEPKAEAPKSTSKSALNLGHDLSAPYANCKTCHAGKAMLSSPPQHNIDTNTAGCATCHTLNPKA